MLADLGAPAARDAGCEAVDPVFAHGIPVPVGCRTDLSFDIFLRPIARTRLRLDFFLNLNFCGRCGHALTCAE
jgi:hypothetical protein